MYLASAGVGTLTLCDNDVVELTNLQRQIVHDIDSLGQPQVESAARRLGKLNPDVRVQALAQRMDAAALAEAVAKADVVLDCSDNFVTRHAVNAACVAARTPLVSGAAVRFDGQLAVFDPRQHDAPCYHCLFPDTGDGSDGPCATFGVFAPLVGIIGCMQAAEAPQAAAGHRLARGQPPVDLRRPQRRLAAYATGARSGLPGVVAARTDPAQACERRQGGHGKRTPQRQRVLRSTRTQPLPDCPQATRLHAFVLRALTTGCP